MRASSPAARLASFTGTRSVVLGRPEVERLNREVTAVLGEPEVRSALEEFGLQVSPSSPRALASFVERETVRWHKLIRDRGLRID